MKKTFSRWSKWGAAGAVFWAMGCAFTQSGDRINGELGEVERLERKRQDYESQYIIVLNGLENHPGDPKLEKEREAVRKKIQSLTTRILAQRATLDRSIREWEQKIIEERIQKEMIEKEERENAYKEEGEWTTTP
jgi:hypothetical protein